VLALALAASAGAGAQGARRWNPLAGDDVHDPASPALGVLQEPREALSRLPPDTAGNQVDWIRALEAGHIEPRTRLFPETRIELRDTDVLLNLAGSTPIVRFPHRQHTQWLDCANCHEHLFKSQPGANRYSMERILQGEQCGVCHGAVAFPLTECDRCHSVPHPRPALATPRAPPR
jgi:c(7)-type cytochrome triheme protein